MPERRQRVRILTLKNLGFATIAAIVLLVAANLISEARRTRSGEYGGLFGSEVQKTETLAPRKVEVVTEAPAAIPDRVTADPLLLAPAAREQQLLDVNPRMQTPTQTQTVVPQTQPAVPDHGHPAIVGDGSGVSVVGSRKLAGGFGR